MIPDHLVERWARLRLAQEILAGPLTPTPNRSTVPSMTAYPPKLTIIKLELVPGTKFVHATVTPERYANQVSPPSLTVTYQAGEAPAIGDTITLSPDR